MTPKIALTLPPGVSLKHSLGVPIAELVKELQSLVKSGSSGQASIFIGDHIVNAGKATDTHIPVMLRCEWPIGAPPRHSVLWVKPSIPEADFGKAIDTTFKLVDNGGVVKSHQYAWYSFNPFYDPSDHCCESRAMVAAAVGPIHEPPTFNENIKMLGLTMNAIVKLEAEPMDEARKCKNCHGKRPPSSDLLELFRQSYNGVGIVCQKCREKHGNEEALRMAGYDVDSEIFVVERD